MYRIKAFKQVNSVLGVLNGQFTILDIERYFKELKNVVEEKLTNQFIYIIDISNFYTMGNDGSDLVDQEMAKIRFRLEDMGMKEFFLIGGSMKTFVAIRNSEKEMNYKTTIMHFPTLEEAINYLEKIKVNRGDIK